MTNHRRSGRLLTAGLVALAIVALQTSESQAVTYNPLDPTMAYMELAATPVQLGPTDDYPGMWEYVYDVYHAVGSWERFVSLRGFEADQTANLHNGNLHQYWDTHVAGGWIFWGGFWDKSIRPSYWNGGGGINPEDFYELPSDGACVGCGNEAYETLNYWHNPFDYHSSIFHGAGAGTRSDSDAGISGNDGITFETWNPGGPNQFGIGGLGLTFRVVHPNEPGTVTWDIYAWNGTTINGEIVGPSVGAANPCAAAIIGDANCDGYVDIGSDILTAFTNFTGPGSFGKLRAEGDVHGPAAATADGYPAHDGDVDVSDILTMFGAFTGPPPDEAGGALGAPAEAGDPAIPDLIYDATTGEVIFDLDGAAGLIGYSLKSAGGFLAGGHTPILGGVTTSLSTELAEAALSTPGLPASIGFVFPLGMDLAALMAFLTDNTVSTGLGAPLVPFDLVVVGGTVVPEPATVAMALFGLIGLGLFAYRRRRVA